MDHQAFAQLLGNYGEFVGAIGVIVTLVYLAAQIRQNTQVVRSATLQASTEAINEINLAVATDSELVRILSCAPSTPYAELTDADRTRYGFLMLSLFRTREALFIQRQSGTATDDTWRRFEISTKSNLQGEYAREWWKTNTLGFTPDFVTYVDSLVAEIEAEEPAGA